jgi:hypothetical protein
MRQTLTLILIALVIALTLTASCKGRRSGAAGGEDSLASTKITYPFTIDVSKEYPMEPISLQEVFGEMEYVALETKPECLIADLPGLQSPVVTDNDSFILSGHNPIVHFARNGTFIKRIGNQGRGPGEFLAAGGLWVNDRTEEIFLYDIYGKGLLVYGYDGKYKRTLKTSGNTIIDDMVAITDSTLLISNRSNDSRTGLAIDPFQLISSRDGHTVKSLMPPFDEPDAFVAAVDVEAILNGSNEPTKPADQTAGFKGGGVMMMTLSPEKTTQIFDINNIYVTAAGVELTHFVADTVYLVSEAGGLTPRWVKAPTPMEIDLAHRRYSGMRLETERYAFFAATAGRSGNMGYKVDKTTGGITQTYLYDANLDHERTRDNRIISPGGVATGRFAMAYQPFQLLGWLEEGKLSGELATLAATLKETDNPVLLISKKKL